MRIETCLLNSVINVVGVLIKLSCQMIIDEFFLSHLV